MTVKRVARRIRVGGASLSVVALAATLISIPSASFGGDVDLSFDFGGPDSPVAHGWVQVAAGSSYAESVGHGFLSGGTTFRDRAADGAEMERDFVNGAWEFAVDLPSGAYEVTTWSGDLEAGNTTELEVEGVSYSSRSAAGQLDERTTTVEVADGQLNIIGSRDGRINGVIIRSPLEAPAALAAEIDAGEDPYVSLAWEEISGATGYRVYRATETTNLELVAETDEAQYLDEDVALGSSYSYAVRTLSGDRVSELSDVLDVDVVDADVSAPETPTGLVATDTEERKIALAWNADAATQHWKVYRTARADVAFELVDTVTDPSWVDSDVLTTRPYLYRVVAVNAGGASAPSETQTTEITTTLVRDMEHLDRAPVAVSLDDGVYVGWRLLGLDDRGIGFNVHRDGQKINDEPLTGATNIVDADGTNDSQYQIFTVVDREEAPVTDVFGAWGDQYLDVPLQKPADGVTPVGDAYSYFPGDASVGDLDGDGEYELVLLWNPTNYQDNSIAGYTGNVYLDAYEFDGTQLWRMDLGVNVRAGAHYTQFQVYDLDGDGRAEVAFRTADGTTDGKGQVIGDANADHRNADGYVLNGPEFLTVFDGLTGAAIDTVDFVPERGEVGDWGDTYGNRVDRFLAGVGYFDGQHPSLLFSRGYYTRSVLTAWDLRDGQLVQHWNFDSDDWGGQYEGQGNHQLAITDVDRDGLDEVVYGAMTIDDDGTPLYNSCLLHGDTLHVGDHVIDRPGLEIFSTFEDPKNNGNTMAAMRDAETGEIIWRTDGPFDTGRGSVADIDPNHPGAEAWHPSSGEIQTTDGPVKNTAGEVLSTVTPDATFPIYWDADPLRELVSQEYDSSIRAGVPLITKWEPATSTESTLYRAEGVLSNGTQAQPLLQADLVGDWREELLLRHSDGNALRLVTTVDPTELRIATLMHDPLYRQAVAWQNTAYNQPPHTSFFIGADMPVPAVPSIRYVGEPEPDTERPEVTLVTPTTGGPFQAVSIQVDATDDRGLQKIVANIYQDGKLVKSTQSAVTGASGSHSANVKLPEGEYTIKLNAHDAAGNVSKTKTFDFSIDTTTPSVTVKDGAAYTVENGEGYDLVSFKLHDAGKVDKVTINGMVKDLTDNAWSDVNFVKPGVFGAVDGENTLVVYDVAGNTQTVTFVLN